MPSKKPKKKSKRQLKKNKDFNVDAVLFDNRQLFFSDCVDEETSEKLIKEMYALDAVSHNPIRLFLNSPGGHCDAGLSIINTMTTIASPVITIITNRVCSMGSHISVAGDYRVCYSNSVWMGHDMYSGMADYSLKIRDRADFLEKYYEVLEDNYKKYTKLTSEDLIKARTGELWLFAKDMIKKGIVDEIIDCEPAK